MFKKLMSFDEARKVIQHEFDMKPSGTEEIPLLKSHSRILGEDIFAEIDIPPFDRSTVDGYATRADETRDAGENEPITLNVRGTVNIGELPRLNVEAGETAEIVTGAPIPKGADAVIMIEHTNRINNQVEVFARVAKNENIMKAGSDIKKGEIVLKRGKLLGSMEIGVLAALGKPKVRVFKVPRIAVFSTGPEIVEPGQKLPSGKIYDINAYTLFTAVQESGGEPYYLGVLPDKVEEIREALVRALESSDMIVTSGGVSVGPKDLMPRTVDTLGKPGVLISGIALKPGKPTTIASINGIPIFSLPGHPTSALLTFLLFARPLIEAMSGKKSRKPLEKKAYVSMRIFSAKGRRTFVMVILKHGQKGELIAEPLESEASGAITTLSKADGFVEIPENVQFIDAGEPVTVRSFGSEPCDERAGSSQ